ncbi:MAG: hypothetical protein K6F39_04050 [Lachnospiraceae bacterium]|nr:hypothetical protein [Lachnospiraceae bacterium]
MKSTLIKDTTVAERIALIKEWEEADACETCGIDLMDYFKDYIDGKKEISQINMEYNANYQAEMPEDEGSVRQGCGMGRR